MPNPSSASRDQNPKGHFLPWVMWGFGALFYFIAIFQRVSPSVMVGELMRDLSLSGAALGNLSAFYFWGYALVQLPTGVLADRWGPRRLLGFSAAICAFGSFLIAFADSSTIAYMGRFIIGVGAGFSFVTTLKIATDWFPTHRFALLSGMTVMIGTVGGLTGQAPLAWVVGEFGWRGAMNGAGLFTLLLCIGIIISVMIQGRPKGKAQGIDKKTTQPLMYEIAQALRQPQTWVLAAAGFTTLATLFAFGALWGVPYLMEVQGFTRPQAAGSMSLMLLGWGIGAPIIGWISDRFARRKAPFVFCSLVALSTISLLLYGPELSALGINILLFINGLFSGAVILLFATVREHNEARVAGTAMAIVNMGIILSGAVMQPLTGWLLDNNWAGQMDAGQRLYSATAFDQALWVLPLFAAIAVGMGLMIRETHGRALRAL